MKIDKKHGYLDWDSEHGQRTMPITMAQEVLDRFFLEREKDPLFWDRISGKTN